MFADMGGNGCEETAVPAGHRVGAFKIFTETVCVLLPALPLKARQASAAAVQASLLPVCVMALAGRPR
jgi:hypothetical protein